MKTKSPILVVDDEPEMQGFLQTLLGAHFDITIAGDGKEAIELIEQNTFLFIVLDYDLPKLTGLQVCEFIMGLACDARPAVVMISGNSGDHIICKAYELGVDDYIVKPFCSTAFFQRMQRLERDVTERVQLTTEKNKNQTLVSTAMEQASQYGSAFELVSRLNVATQLTALAEEVLLYFRQQGFFTAIQLRTPEQDISKDIDTSECSDVELKVFNLLHDKGRIYNFGQRSIFNDESVSLLVKNMPENTTNAYGFLVDIAAKLLPAIDNRVKAIATQNVINGAAMILGDAITAIRTGLKRIELEKSDFVEEVLSQISQSFHHLELTEKQETFFVELIETQIQKQKGSEEFVKVDFLVNSCLQSIEKTKSAAPKEECKPAAIVSSGAAVEFF